MIKVSNWLVLEIGANVAFPARLLRHVIWWHFVHTQLWIGRNRRHLTAPRHLIKRQQ